MTQLLKPPDAGSAGASRRKRARFALIEKLSSSPQQGGGAAAAPDAEGLRAGNAFIAAALAGGLDPVDIAAFGAELSNALAMPGPRTPRQSNAEGGNAWPAGDDEVHDTADDPLLDPLLTQSWRTLMESDAGLAAAQAQEHARVARLIGERHASASQSALQEQAPAPAQGGLGRTFSTWGLGTWREEEASAPAAGQQAGAATAAPKRHRPTGPPMPPRLPLLSGCGASRGVARPPSPPEPAPPKRAVAAAPPSRRHGRRVGHARVAAPGSRRPATRGRGTLPSSLAPAPIISRRRRRRTR